MRTEELRRAGALVTPCPSSVSSAVPPAVPVLGGCLEPGGEAIAQDSLVIQISTIPLTVSLGSLSPAKIQNADVVWKPFTIQLSRLDQGQAKSWSQEQPGTRILLMAPTEPALEKWATKLWDTVAAVSAGK